MIKKTEKIFKIKKGSNDWKVWSIVNTYLVSFMDKKRKAIFSPVKTRKHIKVTVIIEEGKE